MASRKGSARWWWAATGTGLRTAVIFCLMWFWIQALVAARLVLPAVLVLLLVWLVAG